MLIPTLLCPKAWEKMSGDEATRFCSYCKKHVHNLEALSVSERWKLLSSPAASICARYKVAIRRPAAGKRESYMRHMLKYGASVAFTGSALVVLWEMHAENEQRIFYRAVAGIPSSIRTDCGWGGAEGGPGAESPDGFYVEQEVVMLGITVAIPEPATGISVRPGDPAIAPHYIDLNLDPIEINKLLQPTKPPVIDLKTVVPLKSKIIRKFPSLRGWRAESGGVWRPRPTSNVYRLPQ